jgi:predicted phosphodiesterase
VIRLAGLRIAIRRIVYEGGKLTKAGRAFLDREQPDVCIFSHTHQPKSEWLHKTLLFNP